MKRIILISALMCTTPALASSSAWYECDGGRVRLVTAGMPDEEGRLMGVLDVELTPGWKTYWREPGDGGVPPTLDIGERGSAELLFPAPEWHHDGTYDLAGYSSSVALPVVLTLSDPTQPGPIEATAFLGLCKTICIPLKAELVLDPASDPGNPGDSFAVTAAQTTLPDPASADFGVTAIRIEGEQAIFDVSGPVGKEAELFVAGSQGFAFSRPMPSLKNGKLSFTSKVTSFLKAKPKDAAIQYTLKTADKSVSGSLPF